MVHEWAGPVTRGDLCEAHRALYMYVRYNISLRIITRRANNSLFVLNRCRDVAVWISLLFCQWYLFSKFDPVVFINVYSGISNPIVSTCRVAWVCENSKASGTASDINLNPCPAGPGYIRFQESFNQNKMPLKLIKYSVVDAPLIKYFNLGDVYFS